MNLNTSSIRNNHVTASETDGCARRESGSTTINFTGVHSTLSSGETVSFNVILTPNNSGRITTVQVDSQAITVKWAGGITPTAGASGQDVYSFQILKTGTATTDYEIYGAATNYA